MDEPRPPVPEDSGRAAAGGPALPDPPAPSPYASPGPAPVARPTPSLQVVSARKRAGMAVVIGGVLVVIGVFLPWVTASGLGVSASENGIKIGTFGTLILGAFAVARGLSMVRPSSFAINMGTPLIGGILIGVLMALRWSFLQSEVRDAQAQGLQASIGIGVWFVIAGTVLILAGGLLAQRRI